MKCNRKPWVFAAAVPVAGARPEEDYVHAVAHRMTDIPIWAFHGDADTSVPVEGTRLLEKALKELGGNINYTEVAGATHGNIWKIAADHPGMIDWMFSQTNDSFENTIMKEKGPALEAPKKLSWNNMIATWDAVENAGVYKVTFFVDGIAAKTVFTYNNYLTTDLAALGEGKYTFTVRAFPSTNAYSIGDESAASGAYSTEIDAYKAADIDGDGSVTVKDALDLIRVIVNKNFIGNGDVNGDGKVGLADVIRIMKLLTK